MFDFSHQCIFANDTWNVQFVLSTRIIIILWELGRFFLSKQEYWMSNTQVWEIISPLLNRAWQLIISYVVPHRYTWICCHSWVPYSKHSRVSHQDTFLSPVTTCYLRGMLDYPSSVSLLSGFLSPVSTKLRKGEYWITLRLSVFTWVLGS